MIANCDQYIDASIDTYLDDMDRRHLDGLIMTLYSDDRKWSFAAVDDKGYVTDVQEKVVISPHATVGIYNYKSGAGFVEGAEKMIALDQRVNGEFYVAPVYKPMIDNGKKIGIFGIGAENNGMYGLGTPNDLESFLRLPIAERAVAFATRQKTLSKE